MSIDPINTIPIQQFIQQVKSADSTNQKEIRLTIVDAKNLAFTLGIVMSRLQGDLEKLVKENAGAGVDDLIKVEIGSTSSNW
jgi:hypothetical protein|tara:strand:+ start:946 stop:1191 length:246 start_codon:yes stop_codon:yes gene_type:complete